MALEKKDPAVEAARALELNDPKRAKKILLKALGSEYSSLINGITLSTNLIETERDLNSLLENLMAKGKKNAPRWVSVLASAQAQIYKVDPFLIALKLAAQKSGTNLVDDSSSSDLTILFPLLPSYTAENVRGLDTAIAVINSIGDGMTEVDKIKKAVFLTSAVSLNLKRLDANGDGQITPDELLNLNSEMAISILTQIASAAISSHTNGEVDAEPAAAAIQQIQAEIAAQEGDTDADKLKNFIASKKQQ